MKLLPARVRGVLAALLLFTALAGAPGSAFAQPGSEQITGYRVDMEIQSPSGDLVVTEKISYDFGAAERHGIFRNIPVRFTYDDKFDRIYPLEVLSVTGSPGTPDQYEELSEGRNHVIKIGDPDQTVSGLRQYEIVYRIEQALNGFEDHDELYWNAIGFEWEVPIRNINVTVAAPADVTQATCFAGPEGSNLPCADSRTGGREAKFTHPLLEPYESLTVVAGIPKGVVDPPEPILDERWSLASAFRATPFTVAGSLTIAALLGALIYREIYRKGRDRRFSGSPVDAAMAGSGPEEPMGVFERPGIPVEYLPPDNLRPGQVGTLVDETANTLDVIATIVDLAVRGYLRIEEIPKEGLFGKVDWWLHKLKEPEDLKTYEKLLFQNIFSGGQEEVMLSQLEDKFAAKLKAVQDSLYKDVVDQG
ncbi:MAG TPA: DUF2207 domain-containing protein, partial [Actinomycetota bacterium]|nr:DUF2207 domain-containing protein [Actinomycetota bacterium]